MVENLRKLRCEAGLSQKDLAKGVGVTQQSIYKYELNISEPSIPKLIQLAEFFDVSVDYLIGHSTIPYKSEAMRADYLNPDESAIIDGVRKLEKKERKSLLLVINSMTKK